MRHEQAAILILAYVIGFTTAYIAFGVNNIEATDRQSAVFTESVQTVSESALAASPSVAGIDFTNVGMFTDLGGEEVVISGKLVEGMEPGPGFHYHIPFTQVSPNGAYVYYCEQETVESVDCKEYIYSVAKHVIYPLKYEGIIQTSSMMTSKFVWTKDSTVIYGALRSISADTPWLLQ